MGRKKTPANLKVLAGTTRKDRETPDAPEFDLLEEFPDPPLHLNTDGVEMWNQLGPQLVNARVLQVVDLYALEQLCATWQMVRKKIKAEMEVTAAENNALKALFSEFGMTPASRSKVASGGERKKGNKFANGGPAASRA
ncbi:P27 family phage terminase small subunit [Microbulbifer thermotolerans]|uniref:P27 family phage terminase small subunit n=1 Tax=Microbulbifer thermotolerans TaxID=252514 RepID=UPI0026719DA4|nr:P27 family phage terminase small subunit [Microbulbifer thermotolerans]WKT59118.1 P27 family phage terminase small subunit [Microbulbifer thermotolerans]